MNNFNRNFSVEYIALQPCILWDKFDRNCWVGYLVVGWALQPCIMWDKFDSNCRVGYVIVGWALRPCNIWNKFDRNCSVGYVVGCALEPCIFGLNLIGIVG